MINKKTSLLLLSLCTAFVLAACGGGSSETSDSGEQQVLNLVETAEIPTMDSTQATDTVAFTVLTNVNEGLYRQKEDGSLELGMAAEEPTISEDGLTYTFKIRDDADWSNGDPVTANDFVYAWKKLVDPATAASYSYMMDGVIANASEIIGGDMAADELGVTAVDDKTLEVQLVKNLPYFKDLLSLAMFYPQNQAFVEEQGDNYALSSDALVYNGPFLLEDWNAAGLSWTYTKNPDYWDAATVALDQINVEVIKETSTALNLYDADATDRILLKGEYVAQRTGDAELHTMPTSSVFYLKFSQNDPESPLNNINIRKALAMAFDKEAYSERVLQDGSVPANALVPQGLATDPETDEDFREQNGDLSAYDVAAAQEYWQTGLEELGVDSISLELLSDDTDNSKRSSEFIQSQLVTNLPGLNISLRNVPFKVRLASDTAGDYDIQVAGWGADFADPINFLELFETENGNNSLGYSNPEYDALIQQARAEVDDLSARWNMLLEAEQILLEDGAIGPIYQRANAVLEKDYVSGIAEHLVGADYTYKWATVEK
ncbi:peptide ABC transporter substrate-binding protein [Desemzia sp. RIT804]|uniref:peptide ABC transporter substrate-binding protein n=1 Tax=Desemzia sp. RIT 804 TaxID=2810209 RepID=UPI00194E802F|nr:peptide ABC transporter substrate-binding protein [Desemzia sp. RIT 804]MBM6615500.1 peptide ABC transporter substrate-binding protein [Desemzia sp. RIT 804]